MVRVPMTDVPCPRCLSLAQLGKIRAETIMPLPKGAFAPRGHVGGKCCFDCAAADGLMPAGDLNFEMARIAVGNERQEEYRLSGVSGLVRAGRVRPCHDTLDEHLAWLDRVVPLWQDFADVFEQRSRFAEPT